jgi:NAD(P)-dependent dehydrogenase (short-subunit alcohol dehydrogenase family)
MSVNGKVVIITGGAGSIGKATAKLFLDGGARVSLVDLKEDALQQAIKELSGGDNLMYCVADVTKSEDVQNYVKETVSAFGKIDAFFNNAGSKGS